MLHSSQDIDYLQKGKTITYAYNAALLEGLAEEIKKKRPHMRCKKTLFLDDNAPSRTSVVAMTKNGVLSFKLLNYPPYSSDLVSSD